MKRFSILFLAIFCLAWAYGTSQAQQPKRGGTLTIGFKEEPDRLDARNDLLRALA